MDSENDRSHFDHRDASYETKRRREDVRNLHVMAIRKLSMGSTGPPVSELVRFLGYMESGGHTSIAQYWGYARGKKGSATIEEAIDMAYLAAGCQSRFGLGGKIRILRY